MRSMTSGCVVTPRMRNALPHRGHCVTSTAKTRSSEKNERLDEGWAALTRFLDLDSGSARGTCSAKLDDTSRVPRRAGLLGEGHQRAAFREHLVHYNEERNHQGLGGQLIVPPANLNRPGPIVCREHLGGLLRFYDREVA
jgi:hypothetical protein